MTIQLFSYIAIRRWSNDLFIVAEDVEEVGELAGVLVVVEVYPAVVDGITVVGVKIVVFVHGLCVWFYVAKLVKFI